LFGYNNLQKLAKAFLSLFYSTILADSYIMHVVTSIRNNFHEHFNALQQENFQSWELLQNKL
jgi:hypothetical protein